MHVTVRHSIVSDVYDLANHLRVGDQAEVEALGVTPQHAIRRSYRHAILRRTYLVDGQIAAMSGLCGALLSDIGEPYLMTTPLAATAPVTFVKLARQAVAEMLAQRSRLEGYVDANYTAACRLIEVLGFTLSEPAPLGPQNALFRRYCITRAA